MKIRRNFIFAGLIILLCFSVSLEIAAQNPSFFQFTEDEGLPANKVYCLTKDNNGFIWMGSEAGVCKFDGVRFIEYTNERQLSKSITGLNVAPNGRIYCYNFQAQVFYIENDSMHLLSDRKHQIANIACDRNGTLWLTDETGIFFFKEKEKVWAVPDSSANYWHNYDFSFTKNCTLSNLGEVFFLSSNGVFEINKNKILKTSFNFSGNKTSNSGNYLLCVNDHTKWLLPVFMGDIYKADEFVFERYNKPQLLNALAGKKITNARFLPDGNIWITTYSGIVLFNPKTDQTKTIFPEIAFSDCLIDNSGNYWLASLYSGLYRIPNLELIVWNVQKSISSSQKTVKILTHKNYVYFATEEGKIGYINGNKIAVFENEIRSDIQMLNFDIKRNALIFCTNSYLYQLKGNEISKIDNMFWPIKSILSLDNEYVLATSRGAMLYDNLNDPLANDTLAFDRCKDLAYDHQMKQLWITSNKGLHVLRKKNAIKWVKEKVLIPNVQLVALDFSAETKMAYTLSFSGELYAADQNLNLNKITQLPNNVLCTQLKFYKNNLYFATSKGLQIFNLTNKSWQIFDKFSGIASDNILAFDITPEYIWLATNKGIQQVPINFNAKIDKPKIFKKKVLVNKKTVQTDFLKLKYNENLHIQVEALAYNSGNKYRYAYRINGISGNWSFFPAEMNEIPINAIPYGNFEIEIRVFDYQNRISENSIVLKGYKNEPFWQKWWFYLGIALLALWISFVGFIRRVYAIQRKQKAELERINLENEIRVSQLTALKAQMNPHFIFNILNSIKAFIYENDKRSAIKYLNSFSDLTRMVLEMSSVPMVKLSEEIAMIEIYIELEAMLQDNTFTYKIEIDKNLNTSKFSVPALLIQPYIENAFKHGLRHKHGSKVLIVKFSAEPELQQLHISITDNGIGRAAANIINENSANSHKSFATIAAAKRIDLLNKSGIFADLQTIDLYNDMNQPDGTAVLIKLQIHEPYN